jgi:hypothetical protein
MVDKVDALSKKRTSPQEALFKIVLCDLCASIQPRDRRPDTQRCARGAVLTHLMSSLVSPRERHRANLAQPNPLPFPSLAPLRHRSEAAARAGGGQRAAVHVGGLRRGDVQEAWQGLTLVHFSAQLEPV